MSTEGFTKCTVCNNIAKWEEYYSSWDNYSKIEVIENIFNNPELLEVK